MATNRLWRFWLSATTTASIYTLSLHDALPIYTHNRCGGSPVKLSHLAEVRELSNRDRKSTRLNSSHLGISYAVFCLKKKIPGARRRSHARLQPRSRR